MLFNKILYIGCGQHVDVITQFSDTQEFIFVDIQPLSEFDANYFYKPFYRPHFINAILLKFKKLGFMIESVINLDDQYYKKIFTIKQRIYYLFNKKPAYVNPSLLSFYNKNTHQTVKYYVSTDIVFTDIPRLKADIMTCDTLLVSGHHPNIEYLKYFTKPINFIGYSSTYFLYNNVHDNNIIDYFHKNKHMIEKYVSKFFVTDKQNNYIKLCNDFQELVDITYIVISKENDDSKEV